MAVPIKNAIAAAIKYLESGINLATMATLKTLKRVSYAGSLSNKQN